MPPDPSPAAEPSSAVEAMLANLRSAGHHDSSGGFTLDLHKSLETLAHFQLEQPRRYVQSLVSAACTRGATFIQFEIDHRQLLAAFDGEGFTFDELARLFHSLFDFEATRSGRSSHHLAFAMNGARQLSPDFVLFDSCKGGEFARIQVTSGLLQVARLGAAPWKDETIVNRFHLREPIDPDVLRRLTGNVIGRMTGAEHTWPEQELLTNGRCGFAPLQIWVNGQRVIPTLDAYLGWWPGRESVLRPPSLQIGDPLAMARWSGGVGLSQQRYGCIYWILDGLAYRDTMERQLPQELAFWFYCDELKADVSQGSLVQSPELREAREYVLQMTPDVARGLQMRLRDNPRAAQKFKEFARATL